MHTRWQFGIYTWAEDICNTLLTAHLGFKEHFREHIDFFSFLIMKHFLKIFVKMFSIKMNKLGLEQHIFQTIQCSSLFSFHYYIKTVILKAIMACGLEWLWKKSHKMSEITVRT